jgi:hypothetical protein
MLLPGTLGALLEKDLRVSWREPGLRVLLMSSLVGPLLLLFLVGREGAGPSVGHMVLILSSFVGLSNLGTNAFGFERRGVALLFTFPVERWRILLAKNLGALVFRLPGLVVLMLAEVALAPVVYLPAALSIAVCTFVVCLGLDNYASILFPIAVPKPGSNPLGPTAGARGLGALLASTALLLLSFLASAPFVFLCWLPDLLGEPLLWLASLPLALSGAASVYAFLLAGAARLLSRREPDILERILGEW